jgi:hypothetical protein
MYTNADSLFNKLGELQTLISEKKYDIIAITEIFPKKQNLDYNDNLWNIPGYTFHYPTQKVFTHFTVRGFVIYTKVEDFLHDRKQRVSLNSAHSAWSTVASGIPQGSVLGQTCSQYT